MVSVDLNELDYDKDAPNNIYRTKHFIVCQYIEIMYDDDTTPMVVSRDVFFARTTKRDKFYNSMFADRRRKDGRRVHTVMQTREYVA